jgi:hypothetical protein
MNMVNRKLLAGFGTAFLATACLGFGAWGGHKSLDRGTEVTFINTTKFNNGTTLPAGTYRMEVPENSQTPKVSFYKDGKEMATVDAKVVNEGTKNESTEVESVTQGDAQQVTSIQPSGWHEKIVFESNGM